MNKKEEQQELDRVEREAQAKAAQHRTENQAAAEKLIADLVITVAEGGASPEEAANTVVRKFKFVDPVALTQQIRERAIELKEQRENAKRSATEQTVKRVEAAQVDEEGKILVTVPKAFRLTIAYGHEIRIPAGTQKVSKEIFEHWYSKANGMVEFKGK